MRGRDLLEDMTYLDDDLIEEATQDIPVTQKSWRKWMSLAACLLCICTGTIYVMLHTENIQDNSKSSTKDVVNESEDSKDSMPEMSQANNIIPDKGKVQFSTQLANVIAEVGEESSIPNVVITVYDGQRKILIKDTLLKKEQERLRANGYDVSLHNHTLQGTFTKKQLTEFSINKSYGYWINSKGE